MNDEVAILLSELEKARQSNDKEAVIKVLLQLGKAHLLTGRSITAQRYYEEAYKLAKVLNNEQLFSLAMVDLAKAKTAAGNLEEAKELLVQALPLVSKNNTEVNYQVLSLLGDISLLQNRLHSAQGLYEDALQVAKVLHNNELVSHSLDKLAQIFSRLGDHNKAVQLSEASLDMALQQEDNWRILNRRINAGNASFGSGMYERALSHYLEALNLAVEQNSTRLQSIVLRNLGLTYSALGNDRQAIESLQQAIMIAEASGALFDMAELYVSLGNTLLKLDQHHQAIEFFEQAVVMTYKIGNKRLEMDAIGGLGNAYAAKKDFNKAIQYYNDAIALAQAIESPEDIGVNLHNLGVLFLEQGQIAEAKSVLIRALGVLQPLNNTYAEKTRNQLRRLEDLLLLNELLNSVPYFDASDATNRQVRKAS